MSNFDDLVLGEIQLNQINDNSLIEIVPNTMSNDPSIIIYIGLFITLAFGIFFARLMQIKINKWEKEKVSPLPFESIYTITSWVGAFIGITIISTGALEILSFNPIKSLGFSLLASVIPGITMWNLVKELMIQLDSGKVKEIDEYF